MQLRAFRVAAALLPLIIAACGDLPTSPSPDVASPSGPAYSGECYLRPDGIYVCPDQEPIWDECDPYHYDCGADDCISSRGPGDPDEAGVQGCTGGGGGGEIIGDGDDGGGYGSGGTGGGGGGSTGPRCPDYGCPPPDDPEDPECDALVDPDCEQPLTDADTATINRALGSQTRPPGQFTDTTAARACGQMATWFREALSENAVFRGAFDSDAASDIGEHYGAYDPTTRHIHYDPWGLDAANAGNAAALVEVAITAFHESAHRAGYDHPTAPTFDAQGRDYYTDFPFNQLNPGPNSCIPR